MEHAPERPVATPGEVARAVEATAPRFQLAVLLAAWCALRRGEILGLQRQDVDLVNGAVNVSRSFTEHGIGPVKTDAGIRRLAMPAFVVTAASEHLTHWVGDAATSWLFPSGDGAAPCPPAVLNQAWEKAREAIGRPDWRLHDLRHASLTWAAQAGATTADLMRRGGHASPLIALRYQHSTEDRDRLLADRLGELAG